MIELVTDSFLTAQPNIMKFGKCVFRGRPILTYGTRTPNFQNILSQSNNLRAK